MLLVKQGMKNSDTTSSLSDLYSFFNDKSRNTNKIKTIANYLRKPIEMIMLPSGFEPEIIGLRSQYAWPDYTTGACKNENQSQFKAIVVVSYIMRKTICIYINGKKFPFCNFIQNPI